MGSACCVAARDRTIPSGSSSEIFHRNVRYSPSWSIRWDNRRRVAGEETSISWLSDGLSRNDVLETKSETVVETAYASEAGSPVENSQSLIWERSPVSEGNAVKLRTPASDISISRSISVEAKESTESPSVSNPYRTKLSPLVPSTPSLTTSPLSSQSHPFHVSLTPSRWPHCSPGRQLLRQASDSRIAGFKSPSNYLLSEERRSPVLPTWSNESTRGSLGGSSDSWSMHGFSEFMAPSHRERWSFDSESLGLSRDKITKSSNLISSSPSIDLQTCGVCSKLLTEKSSFGSQKLIAGNELSVVAVLICGHVYHSECLENMTPEINKYDPSCPVCTFGEQQAHKLSEKALKAEIDLKAKSKRSRKRVVDSDLDADFSAWKWSGHEGKGPKMGSSSSLKSSLGKPFLRKHFSFGSKGSRSLSENHSTRKMGFFWAKSSKA